VAGTLDGRGGLAVLAYQPGVVALAFGTGHSSAATRTGLLWTRRGGLCSATRCASALGNQSRWVRGLSETQPARPVAQKMTVARRAARRSRVRFRTMCVL